MDLARATVGERERGSEQQDWTTPGTMMSSYLFGVGTELMSAGGGELMMRVWSIDSLSLNMDIEHGDWDNMEHEASKTDIYGHWSDI